MKPNPFRQVQLDGADAPRWLPFASNCLASLRRTAARLGLVALAKQLRPNADTVIHIRCMADVDCIRIQTTDGGDRYFSLGEVAGQTLVVGARALTGNFHGNGPLFAGKVPQATPALEYLGGGQCVGLQTVNGNPYLWQTRDGGKTARPLTPLPVAANFNADAGPPAYLVPMGDCLQPATHTRRPGVLWTYLARTAPDPHLYPTVVYSADGYQTWRQLGLLAYTGYDHQACNLEAVTTHIYCGMQAVDDPAGQLLPFMQWTMDRFESVVGQDLTAVWQALPRSGVSLYQAAHHFAVTSTPQHLGQGRLLCLGVWMETPTATGVWALLSDDFGQTWQPGPRLSDGQLFDTSLLLLSEGRLLLLRSASTGRPSRYSDDFGRTWRDAPALPWPQQNVGLASIERAQTVVDGRVTQDAVLVVPAYDGQYSYYRSQDSGATWARVGTLHATAPPPDDASATVMQRFGVIVDIGTRLRPAPLNPVLAAYQTETTEPVLTVS